MKLNGAKHRALQALVDGPDEGLPAGAIRDKATLTIKSVAKVLGQLIDDGYVIRAPGEGATRRKYAVTSEGRHALEQLRYWGKTAAV